MSRYYANDARYMATVVAEACAIADTCGDQLTPLRCKATRVMSIEDSEEFLDLARTAEACGDLWVAGRMHAGVAFWSVLLGEPDAPIAFERAAAIAEQLDASSLRFALHHIAAVQLAVELKVREAIARLEQAMRLADRASPMMLMAFANLASYCQICGEPAAVRAGDELPGGLTSRLGSDDGDRVRGAANTRAPRWRMFHGTGRTRPWPGSMPARCGSSPSCSARTR